MSKYEGINTVQATVTAGDPPATPKGRLRRTGKGYLKSLMIRTLIALVVAAALFSVKYLPSPFQTVREKAKEIVAFDFIELFDEDDSGD